MVLNKELMTVKQEYHKCQILTGAIWRYKEANLWEKQVEAVQSLKPFHCKLE